MGEREQCLCGEEALTLQLRNHPVIPQKDYKGPEQLLLWFSLVLTQFFSWYSNCVILITGFRPPKPLPAQGWSVDWHRKAEEATLHTFICVSITTLGKSDIITHLPVSSLQPTSRKIPAFIWKTTRGLCWGFTLKFISPLPMEYMIIPRCV